MCHSEIIERTAAVPPTLTRPVLAESSGCRRTRIAKTKIKTGINTSNAPTKLVTTIPTNATSQFSTPNQTEVAIETASATSASPMPSRRCSGSNPFASSPIERATLPTA